MKNLFQKTFVCALLTISIITVQHMVVFAWYPLVHMGAGAKLVKTLDISETVESVVVNPSQPQDSLTIEISDAQMFIIGSFYGADMDGIMGAELPFHQSDYPIVGPVKSHPNGGAGPVFAKTFLNEIEQHPFSSPKLQKKALAFAWGILLHGYMDESADLLVEYVDNQYRLTPNPNWIDEYGNWDPSFDASAFSLIHFEGEGQYSQSEIMVDYRITCHELTSSERAVVENTLIKVKDLKDQHFLGDIIQKMEVAYQKVYTQQYIEKNYTSASFKTNFYSQFWTFTNNNNPSIYLLYLTCVVGVDGQYVRDYLYPVIISPKTLSEAYAACQALLELLKKAAEFDPKYKPAKEALEEHYVEIEVGKWIVGIFDFVTFGLFKISGVKLTGVRDLVIILVGGEADADGLTVKDRIEKIREIYADSEIQSAADLQIDATINHCYRKIAFRGIGNPALLTQTKKITTESDLPYKSLADDDFNLWFELTGQNNNKFNYALDIMKRYATLESSTIEYTVTSNNTVYATYSIETDGTPVEITENDSARFVSGRKIVLKPGFHAKKNSSFKTKITGLY